MRKLFTLFALFPFIVTAQESGSAALSTRPVSPAAFSLKVAPGAVSMVPASGGWMVADVAGASRTLTAGAPDVPYLTYGILTGAGGATVEVTGVRYHDVTGVSLAPSKGNLPRTVNPATLPFVPGPQYAEDKFYPAQPVALGTLYRIREAGGQSLHLYPVQYNPVRRVLRVYDELEVTVHTPGAAAPEEATTDWQAMLRSHFVNRDLAQAGNPQGKTTAYTPLPESGAMLVITPAKFLTALQPFLAWKAQRGIRTHVVNVDTMAGGVTPAKIKALVQARHTAFSLDYLLLVGDEGEVPPIDSFNYAGPSDAAYAYLSGADHYPDLLVGRFSATTTAQLQTQITRSIDYEKAPVMAAAWYPKAIGIASNEGPGDDNQMDWQHMRALRTDLMAAGYTAVGEYYDSTHGGADAPGDPLPADIVAAINGGTTLLNYCGHGWSQGFGTSGFSNTQVPQLTNSGGQWPFVYTVACVTGDFLGGTCLGEAMMRATGTGGLSTGAIGVYSSTINQSWNPPMEAQDETVKLITKADSLRPHSIGALAYCGAMAMNDKYGGAGDEMTDTWVLFGDPSLQLRTRTPDTLKVTHAATIAPSAGTFTVGVTKSTATVVVLHRDTLMSVKRPVSGVTTHARPALAAGDSVVVWVTAPNTRPYTKTLKVVVPAGIEEAAPRPRWTASPNPATTALFVHGPEAAAFTLTDAVGRTVRSGGLEKGRNEVRVDDLARGTYLLTVRAATGAREVVKVQVTR